MKKLRQLFLSMWEIYRESTFLGAVRYLRFKSSNSTNHNQSLALQKHSRGLGIVGVGNYVASIHLPCLRALGEPIFAVTSYSLGSARTIAKVYGIGVVCQDIEEMASDSRCEGLLIATPHYLHPGNILAALKAGVYAYCEKPAAIDRAGIEAIQTLGLSHPSASKVMIGFNRRFSPAVTQLISTPWLESRAKPLEIHYRVNFGSRVNNMMSDPNRGGGRLHGAACHYVDLISFIANSRITRVSAMAISDGDENTFSAVFSLMDGSLASLTFTSEGDRRFDAKEEIMISCDQHVARIINFNTLKIDNKTYKFHRHIYGAIFAMTAFLDAKKNGNSVPVGLADGIAATIVTLAIQKSIEGNGESQLVELGSEFAYKNRFPT